MDEKCDVLLSTGQEKDRGGKEREGGREREGEREGGREGGREGE
jgi:hypothetical protein